MVDGIPRIGLVRLCALVLALAIALGGAYRIVHAQGIVDRFDHYRTGFPLEGRHASIGCESCHSNAVFKGTPRTCGRCHNNLLAEGKPFRHVPTSLGCDSCHTPLDWRTSRFDHTDYSAGCVRCHNNFLAPGKTPSHPATDDFCEACHNTVHWNQILPGAPASGTSSAASKPSGGRR
jgi:uncharacterized paraquat-inducible protein A